MKYTNPDSLVNPTWLVERLEEPGLRVVDLRFDLRPGPSGGLEPTSGRSDYDVGHIPGAVSAPFADNLGPDGLFLSPDELRNRYQNLLGEVPPGQT